MGILLLYCQKLALINPFSDVAKIIWQKRPHLYGNLLLIKDTFLYFAVEF